MKINIHFLKIIGHHRPKLNLKHKELKSLNIVPIFHKQHKESIKGNKNSLGLHERVLSNIRLSKFLKNKKIDLRKQNKINKYKRNQSDKIVQKKVFKAQES